MNSADYERNRGSGDAEPKLKVLWIRCRTDDPGYRGVKAMDELLTTKNVKHVWNESDRGHSWPKWQVVVAVDSATTIKTIICIM